MPTKTDPRIDAYIAKSAPFAQPVLRHLRELVHRAAPEAEETMKWSSPAFVYAGKILCGFAAFRSHCTFGFWHQGMNAVLEKDGVKRDDAMGSMGRIGGLGDLPSDRALVRYIRKAAELTTSDLPTRPSRPRGPARELEVPADLASALRKNKSAAATFKAFPPSHRNEYVEWITEAKRDETRAKRLQQTVAWLAEGKSRNWKYENC
jgi:uncharacterized protein YdeI (YjbR/CyaY-like superfamily)